MRRHEEVGDRAASGSLTVLANRLPVEVLAGNRLIARGELVAIGDGYGVRVIECMIDAP
jgi:flagellar motor switch/type III secretory pathway protein FliN